MIILDTHVLVWMAIDERSLGRRTRRLIEREWAESEVGICALSFWEVALLHARGRLALAIPASDWRRERLKAGLREVAVDGAIAVRAAGLGDLPGDPIDRMVIATALETGADLVTADERLLAWKHSLKRHDARH